MDLTGTSDPFVEIKMNKGCNTAFTTKVQDDRTECFWEKPGTITLTDLTSDDLTILKMFIQVFDYDYDKNDLIGKTEFDLSTLVAQQGSWLNQRVGLMDEKGFPEKCEIYIQCQWIQDGLPPPTTPVPTYRIPTILETSMMRSNKSKQKQMPRRSKTRLRRRQYHHYPGSYASM